MLAKFKTPIKVTLEYDEYGEDLVRYAHTFLDYARTLQYPDPTFIQMSNEVNNLVVQLVNEGKVTVREAMRIGSHWYFNADGKLDVHSFKCHYTFDDHGREGILFPSVDRMAQLLYERCAGLRPEPKVFAATPDGTICAVASNDKNPGIQILFRGKEDNRDHVIAMVEYATKEFSNDHCGDPEEVKRQRNEVPESRRGEAHGFDFEVTDGLICRAWPHIYGDNSETDHRVVYDYTRSKEFENAPPEIGMEVPLGDGRKLRAISVKGCVGACYEDARTYKAVDIFLIDAEGKSHALCAVDYEDLKGLRILAYDKAHDEPIYEETVSFNSEAVEEYDQRYNKCFVTVRKKTSSAKKVAGNSEDTIPDVCDDFQRRDFMRKKALDALDPTVVDLLVTLGVRAGCMESQTLLKLPSGVDGETEFAKWAAKTVGRFLTQKEGDADYEECYDLFMERELVKQYDDCSYTAIAYEDDGTTVADESMYDDRDEAIAFAKSHNWDVVLNDKTGKLEWHRK